MWTWPWKLARWASSRNRFLSFINSMVLGRRHWSCCASLLENSECSVANAIENENLSKWSLALIKIYWLSELTCVWSGDDGFLLICFQFIKLPDLGQQLWRQRRVVNISSEREKNLLKAHSCDSHWIMNFPPSLFKGRAFFIFEFYWLRNRRKLELFNFLLQHLRTLFRLRL